MNALKVAGLAVAIAFFGMAASAQARSLVQGSNFSGSSECNNAQSFATGKRFYVSNYTCGVSLNLNFHHTDWAGNEYGSFSYEVTYRDGSVKYAQNGHYKIQRGRIYFDFSRRSYYPRPGRNYPFGDVGRRGVQLAGASTIYLN